MIRAALLLAMASALALPLAAPVAAKDSLGVYSSWAAFRDADRPRCYAIAKPRSGGGSYASIATWPKQRIRNQVHLKMARSAGSKGASLKVGDRSFALATKGRNAWAQDKRMDAAIVAALRSASTMTITAHDTNGKRFSERYTLAGAATAIDAAVFGCANR
ncbi:MAG: invasion associated locus B family protein [Pseudomonadota bacterium]